MENNDNYNSFRENMSMGGRQKLRLLDEIYQNIQETEWIKEERKKSENAVQQITGMLFEDKDMSREEIANELYRLLMTAEKGGFHSGFCYAVNLLMECGKKEN